MDPKNVEPTFPKPWNPGNERPNTPMTGPLLPPPLFIEQRKYGEAVIDWGGALRDWMHAGIYKLIEVKSGGTITVPQLEEMERESKPKAIIKGIFGRPGAEIFQRVFTSPTSPNADPTQEPLPVSPLRTVRDAGRAVVLGAGRTEAPAGGFVAEIGVSVDILRKLRVVGGGQPEPGESGSPPTRPQATFGGMDDVQQNNPERIVNNLTRESVTQRLKDGITLVAQTADP